MAFLRGPYLRRALSVWAENWYGNSLEQDKALTQFSAQMDSTRWRWSLLKIAKIDFSKILKNRQKAKSVQKRRFCALWGYDIYVLWVIFWRWIEFRGQKLLLRPITWSYGHVWAEKRHFGPFCFFDPNVAIWHSYRSQKSFLTSKFDSASKIDLKHIYFTKSCFATQNVQIYKQKHCSVQSGTV